MSQCKRIFGDICVTSRSIKLNQSCKIISAVSVGSFIYLSMKFEINESNNQKIKEGIYRFKISSTVRCMSQCKHVFGDILLHLAQSRSNSPLSFEGFRRTLRRNFELIRKRLSNIPIDPNCKNRSLLTTLGSSLYVVKFNWKFASEFV